MLNRTLHFSSCVSCALAQFCTNDEPSALQLKSAAKQQLMLKRDEVLCLPNDKFQNLYVIQHGALKAYQVDVGGKEQIRGFYFAGEILGYEAIYTGHYTYSAVALLDTLVCEIPYEHFLELIHARGLLQKQALHLISKQLNMGSYLIDITAEQRLAAFLIDLSTRLYPLSNPTELALPMSREDIGNYLRLTAETVSRIISRLKKNNIIGIHHKKIDFLKPDILKHIANGSLSCVA